MDGSRRGFLLGVPTALAVTAFAHAALARDRGPSATFAGLAAGTTVGPWTVVHVGAVARGGRVLALRSGEGKPFDVEVLLRDASGPKPPGESNRFAVFVNNAGNGSTSTDEDQGLAAMAVAAHLRSNEAGVDTTGFLTMRERTKAFARELG